MFWMSSIRKGEHINKVIYNQQLWEDKAKDPQVKKVKINAFAAGLAGIALTRSPKSGVTSASKGALASFIALQGLDAIANQHTTAIPVALTATAGSAAIGYAIHAGGAETILKQLSKLSTVIGESSPRGASFVKGAENALMKAKNLHPLFNHLAGPEGFALVAMLTALPVAHSLIRRAALKISKQVNPGENPSSTAALHSNAGHNKFHHDQTGSFLAKQAKQQAFVSIVGGVTSHINTSHIITSFR